MAVELLRWIERVLEPAMLVTLLVFAGVIAMALRRWHLAFRLQLVAALILLFIGILPGGVWLALPLERWFVQNPPLPDHVAGIIALGGTERPTQSAAWGQPILNDPTPIAMLLALARQHPEAKLVFTGGASPRRHPEMTEARIVRDFLAEIGIDGTRIIYEDRARNTYENALFTRNLVRPEPSETWILVGQAISLPRAVAVFRHLQWNVIPVPAGYLSGGDGHLSNAITVRDQLRLAAIALHEWGGLVAYRLAGYTDTFFPQ